MAKISSFVNQSVESKKENPMAAKSISDAGFEYFLQKAAQERTVTRSDASLKLLLLLHRSGGKMRILDLAAEAGMEILLFVETIRKMQEAALVSLKGKDTEAEGIMIEITQDGEKAASLMQRMVG